MSSGVAGVIPVSICAMLDLVRHQQKLGNGAIMCKSHSILLPPCHLSPTAHQTHHDSIVSEIMSITTISFQPGRRTLIKPKRKLDICWVYSCILP